MRSFFKIVLAVIIGFAIITLIPLMLLGLLGTLSFDEPDHNITENSILEIDFKTPIIESYDDIEFSFTNLRASHVTLYNLLLAINKAKEDDRIKGISLRLNGSTTDYAQAQAIRNTLANFKSANKFIYAHGNDLSQKDYYIGSIADSIFVSPLSAIELKGISAEIMFYKKLFDKIGLEFEIIKRGKYKSAVEPYFLDYMSPESKKQTQVLIDDIWNNISSEIALSRNLPLEQLNLLTDSLKAFNIKGALQNTLIDGIKYESQYKELLGINTADESNQESPVISMSNYISSLKKPFNKDQIAIIYASGTIIPGNESEGIQDQNIIKKIQQVKEDTSVKAVVLRVNSPGGDASSSERILHELRLLQKVKPLIVSFGSVAASGGYYIAGAADSIVASPNTITGSIGVFGTIPNLKKLSEKIGVNTDVTKTNANSNIFSISTEISPKFKQVIQEKIDNVYDLFLENVAQNRKVSKSEIDSIAQGRVWSGIKAKENGLVDVLGDLNTAISIAAKKADIEHFDILQLPKKKSEVEMLMNKFGDEEQILLETLIRKNISPEIYNSYNEINYLRNSESIHLKLPYMIELK
ncbi:MAG: signal peptide peptidase SppA [Flavobacteriales bacterium]